MTKLVFPIIDIVQENPYSAVETRADLDSRVYGTFRISFHKGHLTQRFIKRSHSEQAAREAHLIEIVVWKTELGLN